jgi:hypothetical protein
LCPQLLLDLVQVVTVVVRDEIDRHAEVPEAPRPPNAMEIRLGVAREVEVDHYVHRLDIDAARAEVTWGKREGGKGRRGGEEERRRRGEEKKREKRREGDIL